MAWGIIEISLIVNACMSTVGFLVTLSVIPKFRDMLIRANLFGIDQSKKQRDKVPESLGVVSGTIFLIVMFVFIPVPFYRHLSDTEAGKFPHHEFVEFITALLSICCMILLGFADDVLDLKWRHKLLLPTVASLPLLMVYFVNFNSTVIIVPKPFRSLIGFDLDLGFLYYVYMGMLAVFCTNAINIYSGINGLECGQSFVIAVSVLIFNFIEISGEAQQAHVFSIFFLMPYLAVTSALLYYNWYPSQVFVGDTFCYFSGMTFAVVAILGHFSKTMLLFFIPQVMNFVYSIPQLFKFIPCPRHRLPKFDPVTDKVDTSTTTFRVKNLGFLGQIFFKLFSSLRLIRVKHGVGENNGSVECSNFTLINLLLKFIGPTHEKALVIILLSFQVFCSIVAFLIRYQLARLFYDV